MRWLALILGLLALCSSCAQNGKHAINLHGSHRDHDGDFGGAEEGIAYGIEGMLGVTDGGLSIEVGYANYDDSSSEGGVKTELQTDEIYAGVRWT